MALVVILPRRIFLTPGLFLQMEIMELKLAMVTNSMRGGHNYRDTVILRREKTKVGKLDTTAMNAGCSLEV